MITSQMKAQNLNLILNSKKGSTISIDPTITQTINSGKSIYTNGIKIFRISPLRAYDKIAVRDITDISLTVFCDSLIQSN